MQRLDLEADFNRSEPLGAANRLHGSINALGEVVDRFLTETRSRAPHPAPTTAVLAEAFCAAH